jgi:O-acetylhomoserine (thiol)-lyase
VLTPGLMSARELSAEQQKLAGISAGTMRLSIGLEDVDDLLADLGQALQATRT